MTIFPGESTGRMVNYFTEYKRVDLNGFLFYGITEYFD